MENHEIWLRNDRAKREITFQLKSGLSEVPPPEKSYGWMLTYPQVADKFSYLRLAGLQRLLDLTRSLPAADQPIFNELQEREDTNGTVHARAPASRVRSPPRQWPSPS